MRAACSWGLLVPLVAVGFYVIEGIYGIVHCGDVRRGPGLEKALQRGVVWCIIFGTGIFVLCHLPRLFLKGLHGIGRGQGACMHCAVYGLVAGLQLVFEVAVPRERGAGGRSTSGWCA